MTDQISRDSSVATVERFLNALRDKDLATADSLLADDLVYQNVGLPTIHGRRRAMKLLQGMRRPSLGFDVKIHRSAADGTTVLNERTDVLMIGPVRLVFWICGVFEVHDGRITLWRDYFDSADFLKAVIRGVAAVAMPSLQRKF